MSIITTERLAKILSETQAVITECNSRGVHGSVEVNARLFENVLMELLRHRAAMLQAADGNSPVIPDGYCIMPLKLTADNGAKGALCGEFHVQYRIVCQSCVGEGCEDCNHTGGWDAEIPVSWDTIKRIHKSAVEACAYPAAPQQETK